MTDSSLHPSVDPEANDAGSRAAATAPGNQARHEPVPDSDASPQGPGAPTSGTVASANPQSPSAGRVAREADLPTDVVGDSPVGVGDAGGVTVVHPDPMPGTSEDMPGQGGVSAATPPEPGHQAGAVNAQGVVGSHRPHAPDGEVSPS